LEADARNLRAQAAAESAAADSLEITKRQYQAGGVSYVALLIAQRQYFQTRQSRVQAEALRYAIPRAVPGARRRVVESQRLTWVRRGATGITE